MSEADSHSASVLLVRCDDRKGLIHDITGKILEQGLNITENSEYVDRETETFFMRSELVGAAEGAVLVPKVRSVLPAGGWAELKPLRTKRVVILATREPHCLGDLLLRQAYRELPMEIAAVVSNYPDLGELAGRFGTPFYWVSHELKSREEHESGIAEALGRHGPDYLVLAKYMRVLSPGFVARFPRRILNIHHSFLPAFAGAKPYQQAYERGVKIIGATAHFVNEDLDEGPIIAQGTIPIDHAHGVREMAMAGREIEKQVLARAVRLVMEERVFVQGNKTVVFE